METREWTLSELHQQLDACYRAASSEYVGMSIPRYLAVALLRNLEETIELRDAVERVLDKIDEIIEEEEI